MKTSKYFMAALLATLDDGSIKQVDIANRTGIAPQTISNIVRNGKAPGLANQEQIAEACGYAYIDFIQMGKAVEDGGLVPSATNQTVTGNENQTASHRSRITTIAPKKAKLEPIYQVLIDALDKLPREDRDKKIYEFLGRLVGS